MKCLYFIASIGTFDVVDTMIKSPSSCLSIKEGSSSSLVSMDDSKMNSSILDPGAPIFIPRQSRQKFDDENETVKQWNLFKNILLIYFSHRLHQILILMIFIILINFLMNFIIQIMKMIII